MTLERERGKEDKIEQPSRTSTIQFLFFVAHLAKLPCTTLCAVDGEWIRTSGRWLRESETRSEAWHFVALSPANSTWTA